MTGYVKKQILGTPGYPQHLLTPKGKTPYVVSKTARGLAMFAALPLEMGDLIVAERPIMVAPAASHVALAFPKHFTEEQKKQAIMFEWEKTLEFAFNRASDVDKEAFLALDNSHLQDG
jgi:hypothetical protein